MAGEYVDFESTSPFAFFFLSQDLPPKEVKSEKKKVKKEWSPLITGGDEGGKCYARHW
jgi:hypothetical protein